MGRIRCPTFWAPIVAGASTGSSLIAAEAIQKLATQYQTTAINVAREYCQRLFLSAFYQHNTASRVLFKGGTALRIIYGSPRFSEGLDFSGFWIQKPAIEELITESLSAVERIGVSIEAGSDSRHVAKTLGLLKASPHQMALFEEEPGLTPERVHALVAENLGSAPVPRSVVGTQGQVHALSVSVFKVLSRMKGLPDVVFLGVAFTSKDQFGQEYSLIVWTQA